jgi:hypothetical protein
MFKQLYLALSGPENDRPLRVCERLSQLQNCALAAIIQISDTPVLKFTQKNGFFKTF